MEMKQARWCGGCSKPVIVCQCKPKPARSCNSDLLLADRLEQGVGCMESLIEYVNDFGSEIDPEVVKAEAGEAILRMKGIYGQ